MTTRWSVFVACCVLLFAIVLTAGGEGVNRADDPVILTGDQLTWSGVMPAHVVGYAYREGWDRIPVQIDERVEVEYAQIYGADPDSETPRSRDRFGVGVYGLVYCDPNTFTGADPDSTFDADDELVFMAGDAGDRAPIESVPAGVTAERGHEVRVIDPLGGPDTYVYLFLDEQASSAVVHPAYVEYEFRLLSGDYRTTYDTGGVGEDSSTRNDDHGPQLNPEDSTIRTEVYARHWSYRWTCDALRLLTDSGWSANLVEREDYWIAPGRCGRHNGTFNAQEGCFIANISGPVRAIRSFLGANSGPLVQTDRVYYRAREDTTLYLRVHPRVAVGAFYTDHTEDAIGMVYANSLNPDGVPIDGVEDKLALGRVMWETIQGDAGSMVRVHRLDASFDIPDEEITLFYADDRNTDIQLCTACMEGCGAAVPLGDSHLIGASGVWITAALPNTDPGLLATDHLTMFVTNYYGSGPIPADNASRLAERVRRPLRVEVHEWTAESE